MTTAQNRSKTVLGIEHAPPRHWVGDGFPVRSMFSYDSAPFLSPFLLLGVWAGSTEVRVLAVLVRGESIPSPSSSPDGRETSSRGRTIRTDAQSPGVLEAGLI